MAALPDHSQEFYETCKFIAEKLAELILGHETNAKKIANLEHKIAQLENKIEELCTK